MVNVKEPLISVIMPVFNAKQFLSMAIESILNQSYRNIELIMIDDGSSDGSAEVCDRFAEKDKRIKIVHQENHGLCYARNKGLKLMGGGYVAFADHDDIWLEGSFEKLVTIFQKDKVDLVKGTYVGEIHDSDGSVRDYSAEMTDALLDLNGLVDNYTEFNYSIRAMWNGLYSADIINRNHIRFDETLKAGAEDYDFNLAYLHSVKKIGLTHYPLYKHYAREGQSASVGYNENRQKGIIKDYHTEVSLLKDLAVSSETYINHQIWYFYMLVREYNFGDTPLTTKEINNRLISFRNEMEDFKKLCFKDKLSLYRKAPKATLKWDLLHIGMTKFLLLHYKRKHM